LYKGRSIEASVEDGQKVSFSAIFDAQFTTLIAALIMYIWGNGAVKGFATMLIITVVMTLLLNVAVSRWLLRLLVNSGIADGKPEWFGVKRDQVPNLKKGEKQFYTGTKGFDYVGKAKYFLYTVAAVFGLALIMGIVNTVQGNGFINLGIDFSSGTKLTIENVPSEEFDKIDTTLKEIGLSNFKYQTSQDGTVFATSKTVLDADQLEQVTNTFKTNFSDEVEVTDNIVTPIVGRDLVRNAIILTLVAWVVMMLYVTFRYEWDYAAGCITALIHDVLIVIAVFCIFRLEVNTELISVLLTVIGYSINNSIVVFDRVREMMAEEKANLNGDDYNRIVNKSLDATIKMSIYSSISTLLPVIFLLFMGSEAIFTFVFAMLVGLIAGTFSSLFIAPTVWRYLRMKFKKDNVKKTKKKAEKKEALDEFTIKGINA
ncbi:MAG: protein translocase subunit SecF, partial [Solobacterium sp.]|nr:protein translocase subunit SecF [Solobacterium sp.]